MKASLIVFLGAGLGGVARHGVNLLAASVLGTAFPFGTLAVNIVGCSLMGVVAGALALGAGASPTLRLFLATGLLGGFTTFSAFSLDAVLLIERNQIAAATFYIVASVAVSIAGLVAGLALARLALTA